MSSSPELFPAVQDHREDSKVEATYYPTLAMSIQFHASLPLTSPYLFSTKTVGCYSHGKVIHQGRHEQLVEVWSAPGEIGRGEEQEGWRKKSMLLASATQIALSIPIASMKTGVQAAVAKINSKL